VPALVKHPLADPWVSGLVEDSAGRMWIRTNDWTLVRVSGADVKTFGQSDGLPSGEVSCLARASDGGIWACTPTGLAHFNGDKLDFHPASGGKFPIRLTHACEASDGVVWAGGASPQLFKLSGSRFDSYTIQLLSAAAGIRSLRCAADRL